MYVFYKFYDGHLSSVFNRIRVEDQSKSTEKKHSNNRLLSAVIKYTELPSTSPKTELFPQINNTPTSL